MKIRTGPWAGTGITKLNMNSWKLSILWVATALVSGCINHGVSTRQTDLTQLNQKALAEFPALIRFVDMCFPQSTSRPHHQTRDASRLELWKPASVGDLQANHLSHIKRTVLEVPGGGGRYKESQTLLTYSNHHEINISNQIFRFDRSNRRVHTQCTLYLPGRNHLSLCTALGKALNKAPDANQRFSNQNVHLIHWNITVDGHPVRLGCKGHQLTPHQENSQQKFSPPATFTGASLSLSINHEKALPTISRVNGLNLRFYEGR